MDFIWWAIGAALVAIWVITIADIVRRRMGAGRTSAWLLVVVLLPFVGAVLYWALRQSTPGDIEQQVGAQAEMRRNSPFDRTR
jgi:hypothetical protein